MVSMDDATQQQELQEEALEVIQAEPWLAEIRAGLEREKAWRKDARATLKRYALANEADASREGKFNILWSNTEVLRRAIYNQPPKPDVRQRWESKDPVALATAELLDRGLTYAIDTCGMDVVGERAVLDYLLPGRMVVRVRYVPTFEAIVDEQGQPVVDPLTGKATEAVKDESVVFENVPWNDFLHADATCWENVDWVAFRHRIVKDDAEDLFPGFDVEKLKFDVPSADEKEDDADSYAANSSKTTTDRAKRAQVWEIWDAREKCVVWVSEGVDEVLLKEEPPLDLKGFFPVPRPALAVQKPGNLVPAPLYVQYQDQAKELDLITKRISKTVSILKWRALYDATLGQDLARLVSEAKDGDLVPTDNALSYVEKGGLNGAIFTWPLQDLANVLAGLYQNRDALKQTIYEITGISDVLRGSTNPNETATAQQLKASWGSSRVDGMKREVQRLFRDLLRIAAEIMSEHFSRETWAEMTSCQHVTAQDKQRAALALQTLQGQMAQFAQAQPMPGQPPQQPDPALQAQMDKAKGILEQASWEEIEAVLSSDLMRGYRVDIETDSTIVPDQQAEMKALGDTMQMLGGLLGQLVPGIRDGIVPPKLGMALMSAVVRKTPLANDMIPIFDEYEQQLAQGNPLEKQMAVLKRENNDLKGQLAQKSAETRIKAQEVQGDQRIAEGKLALDAERLHMEQRQFMPSPYFLAGGQPYAG